MITKETIKQQRWLGPLTAAVILTLTLLAWIKNWFNFGPFWEDPLTAWAAFIGSVIIVGCVIYLIAIFSADAKPLSQEELDALNKPESDDDPQ